VEETNIRILIYEAAFSSMAVSGELDFFSYKVNLTPDQRSRCISYVLQLCKQREKLEFRLISGRIVNDFSMWRTPICFFLALHRIFGWITTAPSTGLQWSTTV
jgi:hypothetical protein